MNFLDLELILALFFIINPLGNVPIFAAMLSGFDIKTRFSIILQECFLALVAVLLFFFGGNSILATLGLTSTAVKATGAVLVFVVAMNFNFPKGDGGMSSLLGLKPGEKPFLTPLAVPMLIGAGTISKVIVYASNAFNSTFVGFCSILVAWAISTIILLASGHLSAWICDKSLKLLERLAGLVLLMMSCQMMIQVVRETMLLAI